MKRRSVVAAFVLLAACNAPDRSVSPLRITSIDFDRQVDTVVVGRTRTLRALVNGSEPTIALHWVSSRPELITVDSTGVISAVAPGTAVVAAEAQGVIARIAVVAIQVPQSLTLLPDTVRLGEVVPIHPVLRDVVGLTMLDSFKLASDDTSIALITPGYVTGNRVGSTTVTALVHGIALKTTLTVAPPQITSVTLRLHNVVVPVGERRMLERQIRVQVANDISWPLDWSSSNSSVVDVTPDGELIGRAPGFATVIAAAQGKRDSTRVQVIAYSEPLRFQSVAVSRDHSCALSLSGRLYCWGRVLTADASIEPRGPVPIEVASQTRFASLAQGVRERESCALDVGGVVYCWDDRTPAAVVASPVPFDSIAIGPDHACGLARDGRAYCWGDNSHGNLGDGTRQSRSTPAPVLSDDRFVQIAISPYFTCGLTTAGAVTCWAGGNPLPTRVTPPVVRSAFRSIAVGQEICAETVDSQTWCWVPPDVAREEDRGLRLHGLVNADTHMCALNDAGAAYCRGVGDWGALGSGVVVNGWYDSFLPVAGGLTFRRLSVGTSTSCGIATDDLLYCWGQDTDWKAGLPLSQGLYLSPQRVLGQVR